MPTPAGRPVITPAKWISGGPTNADNRRGRYRGSVIVQFNVLPAGRAANCTVVLPSGNGEMDALTCRILTERARFTPARDAAGRLVEAKRTDYVWAAAPVDRPYRTAVSSVGGGSWGGFYAGRAGSGLLVRLGRRLPLAEESIELALFGEVAQRRQSITFCVPPTLCCLGLCRPGRDLRGLSVASSTA